VTICSDPLIQEYVRLHHGWISRAYSKNLVALLQHPAEYIPFHSDQLDCVIMINVLDHVADAVKCLDEASCILSKGGIIVIGQDLTNEDDMRLEENVSDIGHPIRLDQVLLDQILLRDFNPLLYRILPRDEGRSPKYHYGTYIFAGQKI